MFANVCWEDLLLNKIFGSKSGCLKGRMSATVVSCRNSREARIMSMDCMPLWYVAGCVLFGLHDTWISVRSVSVINCPTRLFRGVSDCAAAVFWVWVEDRGKLLECVDKGITTLTIQVHNYLNRILSI